jgi:hypothetical protein
MWPWEQGKAVDSHRNNGCKEDMLQREAHDLHYLPKLDKFQKKS